MSNVQYTTVKKIVSRYIDSWAQDHDIENLSDEDVFNMINNCVDSCYEMGWTEKQGDAFVAWIETSSKSAQLAYFRKYIAQYVKWFNGEQ